MQILRISNRPAGLTCRLSASRLSSPSARMAAIRSVNIRPEPSDRPGPIPGDRVEALRREALSHLEKAASAGILEAGLFRMQEEGGAILRDGSS